MREVLWVLAAIAVVVVSAGYFVYSPSPKRAGVADTPTRASKSGTSDFARSRSELGRVDENINSLVQRYRSDSACDGGALNQAQSNLDKALSGSVKFAGEFAREDEKHGIDVYQDPAISVLMSYQMRWINDEVSLADIAAKKGCPAAAQEIYTVLLSDLTGPGFSGIRGHIHAQLEALATK